VQNRMRPTSEKNRLFWIDAARGIAILGIFIVNIGAFSAPFFRYGGEDLYWQQPIDQFTLAINDIFFQASFYTLFSILFGFGIQLMKESLERKEMHAPSILIRRLSALIAFGMIHAFLIWHGDILLSYGLIGFLLLLFLNRKNSTLLGWAIALLGGSTFLFSTLLYMMRDHLDQLNLQAIEQAFESYQSSNLFVIWSQNYQDWQVNHGMMGFMLLAVILLPLFLIGMYMARKRWLHEPEKYRSLLHKGWIITLMIFIVFKAGPYVFGNPAWFSVIQDYIGGTASALFYIVTLTLLAQKLIGKKLLAPFAAVGRMAFTNYIFQSVVCFFLFYGIGLGLYGRLTPFIGIVLAVGIFILQIFLSNWWLNRCYYGPLEWIWRNFTYGERLPLRRKETRQVVNK